jgi:hypothetical protein
MTAQLGGCAKPIDTSSFDRAAAREGIIRHVDLGSENDEIERRPISWQISPSRCIIAGQALPRYADVTGYITGSCGV